MLFLSINPNISMSEENETPTRQLVEVGYVCYSGETTSEGEDNLQSQLVDHIMTSSEVDRRTKAIVASFAMQLETLVQSVRELSDRKLNHSTEGNAASERSNSSGQRSEI